MLGVGLGEDGADRGRGHLGVALGHHRQHVAHEVHPAALPGGADQHRGDGGLQPGVGIGDDQLGPAQAAGLQRAQERGPKRAVLAVADVEPEDFTATVGGDAGGDHDRLGDHPAVDPGLAVGGVEEHIGVGDLGQGPVAECADLLVEVRADPGDLGLGDPGVSTQCLDQVIDLAGRDAVQVGLHHHREQRLVDPAPALEQRGEERPAAELGDPQLQISRGRGQGPWSASVALSGPLIGAFPGPSTNHAGQLGVDQRLVDRLGRSADPVLNTGRLHGFEHLE